MNGSLIFVGLSMGLGVLLALDAFSLSQPAKLTFTLLGLTGLGTALAGVFPENVTPLIHYLIAALCLIIINCGVLAAFWVPELPGSWRWYSLLMGILGLVALVVLGLHFYTPLGPGGIERIADYTPDLWVFTFSTYLVLRHEQLFRFSKGRL